MYSDPSTPGFLAKTTRLLLTLRKRISYIQNFTSKLKLKW